MHCSDENSDHSSKFFLGPTLDEVDAFSKNKNGDVLVPKCQECGESMKPHCMFFDEAYSERFYRSDTVKEYIKDADCLLIIGTALETSFAKRIVD